MGTEYWCDICGTTEADVLLNCIYCGESLRGEDDD
jgi:hypothetical protein